jgi:hypothetical protein
MIEKWSRFSEKGARNAGAAGPDRAAAQTLFADATYTMLSQYERHHRDHRYPQRRNPLDSDSKT